MWTIPLYFLTLLFSFYFYISFYLFSQFLKMHSVHGNTQVTMTEKKCLTAIRSEKNVSYSSNSTLAPCPHQTWLSTLQESYVLSRSAIPPSTYLPLSLVFLSLQIQSIKRDTFLRAKSLLEMFGHTKLIKNAISIEYLKPEDSYRPNCWQKPCNRDI